MNNISVQTFLEDAVDAQRVELEVLSLIQKKYPNAAKVEGNFKYYDLEVPEVATIEVKHDKQSKVTGNFFIECSFNDQPSGLESSTADWWVFVDEDGYYFIHGESLKFLLKLKHCLLRTITGTDGTKILYRLLKKDDLLYSPYCTFLKRSV